LAKSLTQYTTPLDPAEAALGRYHGQPMAAHLPLPIDTPHFDRWPEIFAETARELCPPAAAHFLERAHRIADSLELGIAAHKGEIRAKRVGPTQAVN
jgi:hemoglobin